MEEQILEVNHQDATIDTNQIPKSSITTKQRLAGLLVFLMLFSGSILGPTKVHAAEVPGTSTSQQKNENDPDTVVEIPENYRWEVASLCGKEEGEPITIGDLNAINDTFLNVSVEDGASLEWLNHVGKIEYLTLFIHADDTSVLKDIKSLRNGVKNLSIMSPAMTSVELKTDDFAFLKNSPGIEELSIAGYVAMEPGFLEGLRNIKRLSLDILDGNYDCDWSKLNFLEELNLSDPYTAAIYVTQDDYNNLLANGVKVTFSDPEELETFKQINKRLDEIVESLGVDKTSTDQEKLDAILCYVLDNLTYDPEVSEASRNNQPHSALTRSFYIDGFLYGALEKDTAICGNYAALTNALAERVELDTYYLLSNSHAWSLVEVEGEQYYVDSTWLDTGTIYRIETKEEYDELGWMISSSTSYVPVSAADIIREGNAEDLEWYKEDPNSYPASETQSSSHIVINLPSYFGLDPQEEKEMEETITSTETTPGNDSSSETIPTEETVSTEEAETIEETEPISLDGQEVELRFGNKKWIIGGAAAIGILTALGAAVAVNKKKNKKAAEQRRRMLQDMYSNDFAYGSSYYLYSTGNGMYDNFSTTPTTTSKQSRRGRRRR